MSLSVSRKFAPRKFARACLFGGLFLALVLTGCGHGGKSGPAGDAAAASGNEDAPDREHPIPVAAVPVITGPIASYYEATASLEAQKQADVLARVGGLVQEILVEEGDEVRENQPMLRIDNGEYRLRVEQAAARTAQLRAAFGRMQQMVDQQLASEAEFETAKSELADAEAMEGLARLTLQYTTVVAPFDGQVTRRLVDVGQNVSEGTALFSVGDFHPLLARVYVPSREFRQLAVNQDVTLVLDSDGAHLAGTIALVSPIIDPTSGTIKLTIEVPEYPRDTRPGDFASVRITTEKRPHAILVPRTAVVTDKTESVVYTVVAGDPPTAERRVVQVGFLDDDHAQITSGLDTGDRVVVKGQRSLKPGSFLKVLADTTATASGEPREGGA